MPCRWWCCQFPKLLSQIWSHGSWRKLGKEPQQPYRPSWRWFGVSWGKFFGMSSKQTDVGRSVLQWYYLNCSVALTQGITRWTMMNTARDVFEAKLWKSFSYTMLLPAQYWLANSYAVAICERGLSLNSCTPHPRIWDHPWYIPRQLLWMPLCPWSCCFTMPSSPYLQCW